MADARCVDKDVDPASCTDDGRHGGEIGDADGVEGNF